MSISTRVLVVRPSRASFIEEDIALLRRHYTVRTLDVFEERHSLFTDLKVFLRLLKYRLEAVILKDSTIALFHSCRIFFRRAMMFL